MYKTIFKPILFSLDAERSHGLAFGAGSMLERTGASALLGAACSHDDARLRQRLWNLDFPNPIGLAAGFDKDCSVPTLLRNLGFGHLEFGTVTYDPQPGNERPRMFRIPEDRALINRMGFPSAGASYVAQRLAAFQSKARPAIVGVNIGKLKGTPIDDAEADYFRTLGRVEPYVDYIAINVSSPNTPELRKLQERPRLEALLGTLRRATDKPVLVKFAPDLAPAELHDALEAAVHSGVAGVIATNTTISREGLSAPTELQGGMSGMPLFPKSLSMVATIASATKGALPIVAVGGVFTGADVRAYLGAGASLVQVYTGLVYEGPFLVKRILQDLSRFMDRERVSSIRDLIGNSVAEHGTAR